MQRGDQLLSTWLRLGGGDGRLGPDSMQLATMTYIVAISAFGNDGDYHR